MRILVRLKRINQPIGVLLDCFPASAQVFVGIRKPGAGRSEMKK